MLTLADLERKRPVFIYTRGEWDETLLVFVQDKSKFSGARA